MRHSRPTLAGLPPSIHGDRDHDELAQLHLSPEAILDFSSNKNPYGPHPLVLEAVRAAVSTATLRYYPDRACLARSVGHRQTRQGRDRQVRHLELQSRGGAHRCQRQGAEPVGNLDCGLVLRPVLQLLHLRPVPLVVLVALRVRVLQQLPRLQLLHP